MKYLFLKDQHKRYKYSSSELIYFYFKFFKFFLVKQFKNLKNNFSLNYQKKLTKIGKFRIRINSRCVLTNRSKSIYRKFHISRIQFRKFALQGTLVGIRRSSW